MTKQQTGLLADVIELFSTLHLQFSASYVFSDIRAAIDYVHTSGILHQAIIDHPAKYLEVNPLLATYMQRLRDSGKQV